MVNSSLRITWAKPDFSSPKRRSACLKRPLPKRRVASRHWRISWPDLDDWTFSPFEALRSDETLEIFRRYLTEVKVRTAGAIIRPYPVIRAASHAARASQLDEGGPAPPARLPQVMALTRWRQPVGNQYQAGEAAHPVGPPGLRAGTLTPTSGFAVYRKRVQT